MVRGAAGPSLTDRLSTARKALVAAVTAGIGSLVTAVADGSVSVPEIIVAVGTAIVAGLGVYQTTNDVPLGG